MAQVAQVCGVRARLSPSCDIYFEYLLIQSETNSFLCFAAVSHIL
jgi:hypothetical protein